MKKIICAVATVGGFIAGAVGRAHYMERVLVPQWVRQNPHDGQIGLNIFVDSLNYGLITAVAALIVSVALCRRFLKRRVKA